MLVTFLSLEILFVTPSKMLVQNLNGNDVHEGQAKFKETSIPSSKDFGYNDILHENHQCAHDLPSVKTNSYHGQSPVFKSLPTAELHPPVKGLRDLIETNPEVRSLFTQMLQQVLNTPPYDKTPFGGPQARSGTDLLDAFNDQLTKGPAWLYDTPGQQGLIGFPFNALLNWSMSTPAGLLAFHRPDVNARLRNILTGYGEFLASPASAVVLNSSSTGWLSPRALEAIVSTACLPPSTATTHADTRPQFHDLFISNPHHPTYGFDSWDAFFTRRFRPGIRPTAFPSDDTVIVNTCESSPVALERGVKLHDEFWIKGQPYSLLRIFGALRSDSENHSDTLGSGSDWEEKDGKNHNEKEENDSKSQRDKDLKQAMRFEGGTIYQGFLGALSYHRWHAPVAGTIEKVRKINGTYFAGCPGLASSEGLRDGEERKLDPSAPDRSQRYLCQVGTRALVYIRARDKRLGTVVFVAVGMAEVSSCEVTVSEGDGVEKGQEIGMFHYGGSTHCLIFELGVRLKFTEGAENSNGSSAGQNLPVNGYLAELCDDGLPLKPT